MFVSFLVAMGMVAVPLCLIGLLWPEPPTLTNEINAEYYSTQQRFGFPAMEYYLKVRIFRKRHNWFDKEIAYVEVRTYSKEIRIKVEKENRLQLYLDGNLKMDTLINPKQHYDVTIDY